MNFEKYVFKTVRVKFTSRLGHPHDIVGVVQGVTATKMVFLSLDDDEDYEIIIQLANIKDIDYA